MLKDKPPHSLSSYEFTVPEELVAQTPESKRENAKLFVRKPKEIFQHQSFSELPELLPEGSLIIVNETKVFSCRLLTKTPTGGKLEIFVLENPLAEQSSTLKALIRPAKKVRSGMKISFGEDVTATVLKQEMSGNTKISTLAFNLEPKELSSWMDRVGSIPLPPYIKRQDRSSHETDKARYQTVYAKNLGSVAAPTAGLHFTKEVLEGLKKKKIRTAPITLHVGLGTFLPIKEENITKHLMHQETYRVPKETIDLIESTKAQGKKIILVGTTSLRCLESFFLKALEEKTPPKKLADTWLQTNLFIYPDEAETLYKPQCGDALITNFHQPSSSLFILICSLIGREEALKLYGEATQKKYRFFSYGDSSLLWL